MLGSNEDSGNFTGESRMRIFILLGSKNFVWKKAYCSRVSSGLWGKKAYSCLENFQEFGLYATLLGSYPRSGMKFNYYLVDSQILRQLAGEYWKIEWFPLAIDSLSSAGDLNDMLVWLMVGNLTPLGKKVSSLLRVCSSNFLLRWGLEVWSFNSNGNWGFENITPTGICISRF